MPLTNVDASNARPVSKAVSVVMAVLVHAAMLYAFITGMEVVRVLEPPRELIADLIPSAEPLRPEPEPIAPAEFVRPHDLQLNTPILEVESPVVPDASQLLAIAVDQGITPGGVDDVIAPPIGPPSGSGPVIDRVEIRKRVDPIYPAAARRDGAEGAVLLNVVVGPDGRVTAVTVARSSGYLNLDDAAIAAVKRWQFSKPRAGSVQLSLPVSFRLEQGRF